MIEEGMASFEFREQLMYSCLKASYIRGEQLRRAAIETLGPRRIIDSGCVDVVG